MMDLKTQQMLQQKGKKASGEPELEIQEEYKKQLEDFND
jgi:hypothetical protein